MTAIEKLKELKLLALKKKYPMNPSLECIVPKYKDKKANDLTKCIKDYIILKDGQAERISSSGRYIDQSKIITDVLGNKRKIGSGKWIKPNSTNGTADISAIYKGKTLKIEVKIGQDSQSDAQIEYQKSVESAGGFYFIAKNFQSFFEWFETL